MPEYQTKNGESVEQEVIDEYLDDLRESGITNMYGAGAYVENAFDLDGKTAREALGYWMKHFGERHAQG